MLLHAPHCSDQLLTELPFHLQRDRHLRWLHTSELVVVLSATACTPTVLDDLQ